MWNVCWARACPDNPDERVVTRETRHWLTILPMMNPIEHILSELAAGRMVLILDDEQREN